MNDLLLFGGSFDPMHIGHLWLIRQLRERYKINQVCIMPCSTKAAKNWDKEISEPELRITMCLQSIAYFFTDLRDSDIFVSDFEIENKIMYTHQTVKYLYDTYEFGKLYLAVGSDWDISQFKEKDYILEKCEIIKVPRDLNDPSFSFIFKLSSTDIRNRIKNKLPITGLIAPKTEDYIKHHNLYKRKNL
jgi:nicotinate-nucleotide adenylyltransferase